MRVSGTQPSLLHDSHSHAPAAFPMVVGNRSKRLFASADGKRRFEHRCLRRRGRGAGCLVHHTTQCLPGPQSSSESSESSLGRFRLTFLRGFFGGSIDDVRLSG